MDFRGDESKKALLHQDVDRVGLIALTRVSSKSMLISVRPAELRAMLRLPEGQNETRPLPTIAFPCRQRQLQRGFDPVPDSRRMATDLTKRSPRCRQPCCRLLRTVNWLQVHAVYGRRPMRNRNGRWKRSLKETPCLSRRYCPNRRLGR
jgi:hypothetical protein